MPYFDDHGSAVAEGPLSFAGWREAVDPNDPASLYLEEEAEWWERRLADARAALRLFEGPPPAKGGTAWEVARNTVRRMHDDAATEVRESRGGADVPAGQLTLGDVMGAGEGEEERALRVRHFRVFLRYIAQDMRERSLGSLLRNFLAITRRVMPELVGGMSLVEMGDLIGESKQAVQAREKRVLEMFAKSRGVAGHHFLGKTATEETRRKLAEAQRGNKHRSNASKRQKGAAAQPPALPVAEARCHGTYGGSRFGVWKVVSGSRTSAKGYRVWCPERGQVEEFGKLADARARARKMAEGGGE